MSFSIAGRENLRRLDAEMSCTVLLNSLTALIERAGPPANDVRQPIPFERQLELVSQGKARVVPVIPIRKPDPDFTIGGVSGGWAA